MATYTTPEVDRKETESFYPFPSGTLGLREATWTGTISANDIVEMVPVNKGERVVGLQAIITDSFGNLSSYDIGDGDDLDRYVDGAFATSFAQLGQGISTTVELAAVVKVYTENDTIDLRVASTSGTSQTGSVTLRVFVSG